MHEFCKSFIFKRLFFLNYVVLKRFVLLTQYRLNDMWTLDLSELESSGWQEVRRQGGM